MACCGVNVLARSDAELRWYGELGDVVLALDGVWTPFMPPSHKGASLRDVYGSGVRDSRFLGNGALSRG